MSRLCAAVLLSLCLLFSSAVWMPVQAEELVWRPYLQQLSDTSVVIMWVTRQGQQPSVRYSPDQGYATAAVGSSRALPAFGTVQHRVVLANLQPGTRYFYKIYVDGQDLLPAEVLVFQTAPAAGSSEPFRFLAFGDFGSDTSQQEALRDQMLRDSFSFMVTTGDNAYPDGTYEELEDTLFQEYDLLLQRLPIWPSLGNHDYHSSDGEPYLDLFDLPRQALRPEDQERYYSFDYGSAHFVVLDSNLPLDAAGADSEDDMLDWLRQDLQRATQRWKIAVLHHSPYSNGHHGSDGRVQEKLVPLFEQFGVQLVLTGHDHIYTRSKPLHGGAPAALADGGIVYVITGAGDRASYPCEDTAWIEVTICGVQYGLYSRITVAEESILIEAVDQQGSVRDSYRLEHATDLSSRRTPLAVAFVLGTALLLVFAAYLYTVRARR